MGKLLYKNFIYEASEESQASNVLVIKKGTILYHGSMEEIEGDLRPGGYDGIFWTSDNKTIARTYIPSSGATTILSAKSFLRPADKMSANIRYQKQFGIDFGDNVEYDDRGRAKSWRTPKVFNDIINNSGLVKPEKSNYVNDDEYYKELFAYNDKIEQLHINYVVDKFKQLGYTPDLSNTFHGPTFKEVFLTGFGENGRIAPYDYQKGQLFTIRVEEDLKLADMTNGETIEGDLTDVDYRKLDEFDKYAREGYDGVKINDFAQVRERTGGTSNVGHVSIGLFETSIKKINVINAEETTHPIDFWKEIKEEKK